MVYAGCFVDAYAWRRQALITPVFAGRVYEFSDSFSGTAMRFSVLCW